MLAVLAVTGLITVACADDTDTGGPAAPPGPGTTADATQPVTTDAHRSDGLVIDVTIEDGSVTPTNERFQGRVGEPITLRETSHPDPAGHHRRAPVRRAGHRRHDRGRFGHPHQRTIPGPGRRTHHDPGDQRHRRRVARALDPGAHLRGGAPRRSDLRVHRRGSRPGGDRTARSASHHRDGARAAVTYLAHGIGGSTDLPTPSTYALIAASRALAITFAGAAVGWRRPRFDPDRPGRALPRWVTTVVDAAATRWALAAAALLFTGWVALAAFFGPQDRSNPLPGVFYVLLWVGLVALSVLIGPVWRAISPVRAVYRLLSLPRRLPDRGYA